MKISRLAPPKSAALRVIITYLAVMLGNACGGTSSPAPGPAPGPVMTSNPCAGVSCSGHGVCNVESNGAVCTCDAGYRADGVSCKPSCDQCGSRVCGGDNGCGQSCGTCPTSYTCTTAGQCVAPPKASLKVVNNSTTTIWYLYVSPTGNGTWGTDQLGGSTISSGSSFTLNGIPCPAYYDLKVDDRTRTIGATRYNVQFNCGVTTTWTLN